ncbi:MAG: glycosyltransferase family 2 protein [Verrucomicrobiales bacterium]|nr:glycosyltransferase family 2 protein [Verrucomicrobiales bacterium]
MMISIITASYGSERTIGDTIRSINSQAYGDWVHHIVDGRSGDRTLEICSDSPDERRQVTSEPDEGVYDAMSKGIRAATGDVIGFLNADDFYESDSVLGQIAAAFEEPGVDLVYGNLRYVDFDDTNRVVRDWKSEPYEKGMFRRGWMPPHPTVYARRGVFEKYGVFDQRFEICADWEWLYRMIEIHGLKAKHIDEYWVRMRLGGVSNQSVGNVLRSNRQAARAFSKHGQRVPLTFFPGKILHRLKQFM